MSNKIVVYINKISGGTYRGTGVFFQLKKSVEVEGF